MTGEVSTAPAQPTLAQRKAQIRLQLEADRQRLGEEVGQLWQPLRRMEDRGRHLGRRLQALGPPLWLALAAPLLVVLVRRRPTPAQTVAREGRLTSVLRLALLLAPWLRRGHQLVRAGRGRERP